jgi:hypothetical protein
MRDYLIRFFLNASDDKYSVKPVTELPTDYINNMINTYDFSFAEKLDASGHNQPPPKCKDVVERLRIELVARELEGRL